MAKINKFLTWWARQTTTWILVMAIIQVAQIPHMVWNADMLLEAGYISRVNAVYDFILYGIDLIEAPSIMIAFTTIAARLRVRRKIKNKYRCDW